MNENKNCLSYWLPRLQSIGAPVPKTEIVRTDARLDEILDGVKPDGYDTFIAELSAAADRMGYPCFLRTGHSSFKHNWRETCYLAKADDLKNHVAAIVDHSGCYDLPTNVWAVREFLDLRSYFAAFGYGMPVAVERRWFFGRGKFRCSHPYWPADAIRMPSTLDWEVHLATMERVQSMPLVLDWMGEWIDRMEAAFVGSWSVDFALGTNGQWWIIDCAEAEQSFHWNGCPNAEHYIGRK